MVSTSDASTPHVVAVMSSARLSFLHNYGDQHDFKLSLSHFGRVRGVAELRAALHGLKTVQVHCTPGIIDVAPDAVDVATLADALVDNTSISYLGIQGGGVGDDWAERLFAIIHTTRIETLTICQTAMGPKGARSIAVALRRSPRLVRLYLSSNRVGDEGVVALAESLRYDTTLRLLGLSDNRFSDVGARSLVECLRCNGRIETVSLGSNPQVTNRLKLHRSPEERRLGLARQRASLAVLSLCSVGDRYSEFPVVRAVGGLDWNSDGDNVAKRTLRNYLLDLEFLSV